jgi:hypothetical protein
MITLLATILLAQSDYETRAAQVEESIAEERLRAAESLESIKAWRFARNQYFVARQVPAVRESCQNKLDALRSKSTENESFTSTKSAKALDLVASIGKLGSAKHRELAQWCASQKLPAEAKRHWGLVLKYDPSSADAVAALGLSGTGAGAVDQIWKDVKFGGLLADADGGKVDPTVSDVAQKWRVKTARRVAMRGAVELEGVDIPQERLSRLAKVASANIAFWRVALGEADRVPSVRRFVVLNGDDNYQRYIDDFYDAPAKEKALAKDSGGTLIPKRKEFVTYGDSKKDSSTDFTVAEYISYFMVDSNLPPWISVAVGSLPQKLLLGRVDSFSFEPPKGTDQLDKDATWADEKKFQDGVRGLVLDGKDVDFELLTSSAYNALSRPQIAKSMSVLRFLVMRWPGVFRDLVNAYRPKDARPEKAEIERILGCTLQEFDEHWRRWVIANK